MYEYRATCITVKDGDTVDIITDLGFDVKFGMRLRLAGIDTPEIHGNISDTELLAGTNAKRYVETCIAGKEITITTQKDKQEKFGRYLADVYFVDDKGNKRWLNQELIQKGYARPYQGEKKPAFDEKNFSVKEKIQL